MVLARLNFSFHNSDKHPAKVKAKALIWNFILTHPKNAIKADPKTQRLKRIRGSCRVPTLCDCVFCRKHCEGTFRKNTAPVAQVTFRNERLIEQVAQASCITDC